MGINKLTYYGPVATPTEYLTTLKFHWNRVISTPDAKYLIVDVKKFHPNNTMKKNDYYKIAIKLIPQEIVDNYYLNNDKIDSYIYAIVERGMYVLVQAGIIAHNALNTYIKPYSYATARIKQGLWMHKYRDINFTQVVDEFGINYMNKKDAYHLIASLQTRYEVTQYCKGGLYCGIILKWKFVVIILEISIPGYVKDTLHKFRHPIPNRPQQSPHQWIAPKYSSTAPQMLHPTEYSPALNPEEAKKSSS